MQIWMLMLCYSDEKVFGFWMGSGGRVTIARGRGRGEMMYLSVFDFGFDPIGAGVNQFL
jgi:hypothetical protein